ncbi:hypothetical protein M514_05089 [Trichuris suis]|uniref:Uncharacterized protein n=1 Tax=Trichuris suis TaxID=68888 RepID=A0A085MA24_9BILA|nr:hypothetical protein M513_05089 [Trichuris suis]KFD67251.1 hypothetical protein M514_05089 [Trichuris suis]
MKEKTFDSLTILTESTNSSESTMLQLVLNCFSRRPFGKNRYEGMGKRNVTFAETDQSALVDWQPNGFRYSATTRLREDIA